MSLDCEIVTTRTGARAIRDRLSGELMHPVVGPCVEAQRLYVQSAELPRRLAQPNVEPLVVLDVGLGAGSNAAAAWREATSPSAVRRMKLLSYERSLDALGLALDSGESEQFGLEGAVGDAARALRVAGEHRGERVHWCLRFGEILQRLAEESDAIADVVFWDPFSPDANPELWTYGAFAAARRVCRPGATLHTYSGATSIRAALLLAGFSVGFGEIIGPGRRATVAATDLSLLREPLDSRWFRRLERSSVPLPPDAPPDAWERLRAACQFR